MVLDIEDLLLLTLMRLRVGTPEFDLAFRFQVSQLLFQEYSLFGYHSWQKSWNH